MFKNLQYHWNKCYLGNSRCCHCFHKKNILLPLKQPPGHATFMLLSWYLAMFSSQRLQLRALLQSFFKHRLQPWRLQKLRLPFANVPFLTNRYSIRRSRWGLTTSFHGKMANQPTSYHLPNVTKHFRYLKWRYVLTSTYLYKLYGYGLCKGKPTPKIPPFLGTWTGWWQCTPPPPRKYSSRPY